MRDLCSIACLRRLPMLSNACHWQTLRANMVVCPCQDNRVRSASRCRDTIQCSHLTSQPADSAEPGRGTHCHRILALRPTAAAPETYRRLCRRLLGLQASKECSRLPLYEGFATPSHGAASLQHQCVPLSTAPNAVSYTTRCTARA